MGNRQETELSRILKGKIRSQGPITFKEFMAAALYDPYYGFYAKGPAIGTFDGTFNTNAMYKAFAFALAQVVKNAEDRLGVSLRIVELGGGTGQLGSNIQSFLVEPHDYVILESSAGFRDQQRAQGLQTLSDCADLGASPSFIFGNEVLDAFPVHRVMGEAQGTLLEQYVALDERGEFTELFSEPSSPALNERLKSEGISLGRGQIAEICLGLEKFLDQAVASISSGYLLLVDYGDEAKRLYHHTKRNGTLRTFLAQRQTYDPYDCVGEQDLTVDVDYTAVVSSVRKAGLDYVGKTSQGNWLQKVGIEKFIQLAEDTIQASQEITQLTASTLLGSTFDVLAFKTQGLPNPPGFE